MTKKLAIWEATLAKPRLISSMIPSSSSRATTAAAAGACEMGRGIGGNSEESGAHNDTVGDGGADRPLHFHTTNASVTSRGSIMTLLPQFWFAFSFQFASSIPYR